MAILGSSGYRRIAETLRKARSMSPLDERRGVERAVRMLAYMFQQDNKRFDLERFYENVGLTAATRQYSGMSYSKESGNGSSG